MNDHTEAATLQLPEGHAVELARETLGRDLLEALIMEIRLMPDVWEKLGQEAQDDVLDRLRNRVRDLTRQAVGLIVSSERTVLAATVESVTFKDGIKATLKIAKTARGRHDLADQKGADVVVVIADPGEYLQGMDAVRGEDEQLTLQGIDKATGEIIARVQAADAQGGADAQFDERLRKARGGEK
ncbi:MAG: hypothetical protein IPP91_11205 [Betaproteobacteria bacterium]|nr:hypothetical protein [Betaproteobacteria bacterium]